MIIDFHAHIFPEKIAKRAIDNLTKASHLYPFADGTAKGLISSMEKSGTDHTVIAPVAVKADSVKSINTLSISENGKDGLIYFGCMHPDFEDYENELKRLKDGGVKGIKIHPVSQDTDLDDERYIRIIKCCAENDLIVLCHGGTDLGFPTRVRSTPKMAYNVLEKVPDVKFIMAHMGGHHFWDSVPILAKYENIFIDTSTSLGKITALDDHYTEEEKMMLPEDEFLKLIEHFGANRVLFATDSPWADQLSAINDIKKLPLTDREKDLILGENARKLLKI